MSSSRSRKVSLIGVAVWWALLIGLWFGLSAWSGSAEAALYRELGPLFGWWADSAQPQLVPAGAAVQTEEVERRTVLRECPMVGMVQLNHAAMAEHFSSFDRGPQTMAGLLSRLSASGVRTVGLSATFLWEDGVGDMGREMLCHVLRGFPHSAVGLRGRTAAQADYTPLMLRDAAIPEDNITGDPSKLPMANKPLPNGLTDAPDSLNMTWAPDWLQDEPMTRRPSAVEDMSFPLLVRWNGETIPTLPFRLALAHLGLSPADVKVNIGRDIRYGGFSLPLDEYGRTRLKEAQVLAVSPGDVLDGRPAGQKIELVMVEQPSEQQDEPLRLERLARTLSQMAGREKTLVHTETQPVGGVALAAAIPAWTLLRGALGAAGLFAVLFLLPRWPRLMVRLLLCGCMAAVLYRAYTLAGQGLWLPVCALLLWFAGLWLALHVLRPARRRRL